MGSNRSKWHHHHRLTVTMKNNRGFSLLEVVIAAVVMATAAVGLLRVVSSTQVVTPLNVNRTNASSIARQQIEFMSDGVRQDWWNNAAPYELAPNPGAWRMGNPVSINSGGVTFNNTYQINNVVRTSAPGTDPDPGYRRVDYRVSF